jgi:hypothetical protein
MVVGEADAMIGRGVLAGKRIFAWWACGCMASLRRSMDSGTFHRSGGPDGRSGGLAGCGHRHCPWISGG